MLLFDAVTILVWVTLSPWVSTSMCLIQNQRQAPGLRFRVGAASISAGSDVPREHGLRLALGCRHRGLPETHATHTQLPL